MGKNHTILGESISIGTGCLYVPDNSGLDYGKNAAQRWMDQCRKQTKKTDEAGQCLQDCAECLYPVKEEEADEEQKID